jgi:hypothetical protein
MHLAYATHASSSLSLSSEREQASGRRSERMHVAYERMNLAYATHARSSQRASERQTQQTCVLDILFWAKCSTVQATRPHNACIMSRCLQVQTRTHLQTPPHVQTPTADTYSYLQTPTQVQTPTHASMSRDLVMHTSET